MSSLKHLILNLSEYMKQSSFHKTSIKVSMDSHLKQDGANGRIIRQKCLRQVHFQRLISYNNKSIEMLENNTIYLDEEETSLPLSIHKVFFFFWVICENQDTWNFLLNQMVYTDVRCTLLTASCRITEASIFELLPLHTVVVK